jgi:hypothetical protein
MAHIGCAPSYHPLTTLLPLNPWRIPCRISSKPVVFCGGCACGTPHGTSCLQDKKGILFRKSTERVQVSTLLLTRWAERFSLGNNLTKALLKNKKKSIHPSPLGQLKPLEETLLKYIFEQHKQGIKISTLSIIVVASNFSTEFGKKDFATRCSTIKHFVSAHSLV